MAMLLIYSPKCVHSKDIVQFILSKPELKQVVSFHDIHSMGIPQQFKNKITSVPTLLTKNGKLLVGNEVKQFLFSLLPCDLSQCSIGGCGINSSCLDGETEDDLFILDNYGESLQPAMTQELQNKIQRNVSEAYDKMGR